MTDFHIRSHRVGDIGFVVQRQGLIYAEQYGWGIQLEAHIAKVMASYIENYNEKTDRTFIAERRDGTFLGCVMVCKETNTAETARLRLLLVEPAARGMGLGTFLVKACVNFATDAGYKKIVLSTQSVLSPALKLYQAAGFKRIREEDGLPLSNSRGECWQLDL